MNKFKLIKNVNFSLRNIAFIKKYVDDDSLKILVHNYIVTRLDYCNSLYYELPAYQLKKLQLVFNKAARLIVGVFPRERITPVHIDLHWLPIKARIMFKICVLTYIALNTGKPAYLRNKLTKFRTKLEVSIRQTHDPHRLNEPRMNKEIGTRSFKYIAPRLFNSLPRSVKDSGNLKAFKKKLKTFLFNECYFDTKTITDRYCIWVKKKNKQNGLEEHCRVATGPKTSTTSNK